MRQSRGRTPRALFLVLVSFLGWLPARAHPRPESTESLRDYAERSQRRQAYGVYAKGQKLGWAIDEFVLDRHDGRDVAVHTLEVQGRVALGNEVARFEEKETTCYELEGQGEIVFAEKRSLEDGNETVYIARRQGAEMVVTTRTPRGTAERRVGVPKETLGLMRDLERWLHKPPGKSDSFVDFMASWDEDRVDTPGVIRYRGRRSILWGGVRADLHAVRVQVQGMLVDAELLGDGTPVRGRLGGLFDVKAEKETVAKGLDHEPPDMLEASSIIVNEDLGDPGAVDSLRLKVVGPKGMTVPTSSRQRIVSRRGAALYLELTREGRRPGSEPLLPEERQEFLKSTPTLQSDHPALRQQATRIVTGETDPLRKIRLLQEWVFSNMRPTMVANGSTALGVLETRAGDCTEITPLFVALARAVGIPAREVGGLAYANETPPLFGWHAWAEAHDGHQWVSVDPTWNQIDVDATHLKLTEDTADWSWINLVGRLRIRILGHSQSN